MSNAVQAAGGMPCLGAVREVPCGRSQRPEPLGAEDDVKAIKRQGVAVHREVVVGNTDGEGTRHTGAVDVVTIDYCCIEPSARADLQVCLSHDTFSKEVCS